VRTRAAERSLKAAVRSFLASLRAQRYSEAHLQQSAYVLGMLTAFLDERDVRDAASVSEAHLACFARKLAGRDGKSGAFRAASQAAYLGRVKSFFAFLERNGKILRNPALELALPKEERLPRGVLSVAEARRLVNAADRFTVMGQRDSAVLELLYGTGIRLGECMRLDTTDVELSQGELLVRDGKGRQDRKVPLSGEAARALDLYLRCSRPVLLRDVRERALVLNEHGRRITRMGLYLLVRRYGALAGIKSRVFPHGLRHTYATHLLRGGAGIREVQELLGHKQLRTTEIYTRVDTSDLRQVIARCHPRERVRKRRRKT
jgi:integrase/recombinase XerD